MSYKNIFSEETVAINQILNDKHTLIEGYIVEHLFKRQFIDNTAITFTNGWWVAKLNQKRYFFIVKDYLNELDIKIIKKIPEEDECWQAILNYDKWEFRNKNEEILQLDDFVYKEKLHVLRNCLIATTLTRDRKRQEKCVEYFKENNLLDKIAIERFFANNFLSVYFDKMVNIDYFVMNTQGDLFIIEVKYKYESFDGHFGINVGQMEVFKYFNNLGFNINHLILYNHTRDQNLSIFGFLELDVKRYWLFKQIGFNNIPDIGIAPERTSVSGSFKQPYYKLRKDSIKKKIELRY